MDRAVLSTWPGKVTPLMKLTKKTILEVLDQVPYDCPLEISTTSSCPSYPGQFFYQVHGQLTLFLWFPT